MQAAHTICTYAPLYHQRCLCLPTMAFSNVNDRIMPMSDAVASEGPETTGIQQKSSYLYFVQRPVAGIKLEMSSFSG